MRRWHKTKDVATGRWLPDRTHARELKGRKATPGAWWVITASECPGCAVCEGYEVCLHSVERFRTGGGSAVPIWPILSCRTREHAEAAMNALRVFAKAQDANSHDGIDKHLIDWLEGRGWSRKTHMTYSEDL